jgi:hypothetical protein
MGRHALLTLAWVAASLGIGVLGYRGLEGMSTIDALLNASMILGGMGPVGELHTAAGKLFASAYALYSGMGFLVAAAVLFSPVIHRVLHRFHLPAGDGTDGAALRRGLPAPTSAPAPGERSGPRRARRPGGTGRRPGARG